MRISCRCSSSSGLLPSIRRLVRQKSGLFIVVIWMGGAAELTAVVFAEPVGPEELELGAAGDEIEPVPAAVAERRQREVHGEGVPHRSPIRW